MNGLLLESRSFCCKPGLETRCSQPSIPECCFESRARELGINHLDTSDMYGPHTNEQLVGESHPFMVRASRHYVNVLAQVALLLTYRIAACLGGRHLNSGMASTSVNLQGKQFRGQREKYDIATKFGAVHGPSVSAYTHEIHRHSAEDQFSSVS